MYSVHNDLDVDRDCVKAHDSSVIYRDYLYPDTYCTIKALRFGFVFYLQPQAQ